MEKIFKFINFIIFINIKAIIRLNKRLAIINFKLIKIVLLIFIIKSHYNTFFRCIKNIMFNLISFDTNINNI